MATIGRQTTINATAASAGAAVGGTSSAVGAAAAAAAAVAAQTAIQSTHNTSWTRVKLISQHRGRKVYSVNNQNFEVQSRYSLLSVIGRGAYGVVCSALDNQSLEHVAIKRIKRVFDQLIDGRRIYRQIRILRLLREGGCRHILSLLRVMQPKEHIVDFKQLCIVTDLYDRDLYNVIRHEKNCSVEFIRYIGVRLLRCLSDMHALGVIHRDIKPSNILLRGQKNKQEMCVCDFGLARAGLGRLLQPLEMTDYVVTRWYRPPQLLLMAPYNYAVDLWAVGCVMAQCALGTPLFAGRDYIHQLQLVLASIPVHEVDFLHGKNASSANYITEMAKVFADRRPLSQRLHMLPSDCFDIINKLLTFDPRKRPTAQDALEHSFFESVGGADKLNQVTPSQINTSFDIRSHFSQFQLRRAFWDEVVFYNTDSSINNNNNSANGNI